jgi:hypothetical protein
MLGGAVTTNPDLDIKFAASEQGTSEPGHHCTGLRFALATRRGRPELDARGFRVQDIHVHGF